MKRLKSLLIGTALSLLFSIDASAGSSTVTGKDAAGTTHTWDVITDGTGNFVWQNGICDGTAAAQCVAVKPASTAAGATDPAMVVAISPNNAVAATQSGTWNVGLSAGGNTIGAISNTTFASTQSGTWNITNISGTVSLPTGAATSANQPTNAAQASTTSGQTGNLIQGAVTTGSPTYTTGQTDPISIDTAGNLRVGASQAGTWNITNVSGTVSLPTGAATSALQTTINTTLGTLATSANQTNASQKTQIVDGSGNVIASTSNNLNVQCANCSGSGASAADAATFTAGTSVFAPTGGQFTTGGATACVTGHQCVAGMTAARAMFSDTSSIAGTATATGNGVSGAGTQRVNIASDNTAFSVNATLQASATTAIGKVDPNTIGNWGLQASTQNSATPTNGGLVLGQFNTSPTTITSGNVSPLQMDNAGNLLVNIKAGSSSGAVAQGSTTSGQTGGLVQAAATSSAPTYTTATTNPLSMDTSGNLRVVGQGIAQGSTTSGQSGSLVMGAVTTSAPTYTTAQSSPLSLDTAGNLRVNVVTGGGSGGTSSADAAAWTAGTTLGTQIAGEFTTGGATACTTAHSCTVGITAARGIFTDMSSIAGTATATGNGTSGAGTQRVNIASDNTAFTVNAAESGTWNITNITGTVSLPTGAATSANQPTNAAQGSTTSGQTGRLILGAVTTASPTYTTAQSSPLSLDTAGNLRVNVVAGGGSGGTSIADAGTFTAGTTAFTPTGGQFTTGGATACVSGHACWVGMTAARGFFTDTSTVNGVTVLTGTGAVGTGAQRIAVGTDTATIAGSAPGTAGTASTNVVSVQGIASMTPLVANPGTASNWGVQTQGSTTSGQSGPLVQAAVSLAAPVYTDGTTAPLSIDTGGLLRISGDVFQGTASNLSAQVTPITASTWGIQTQGSTTSGQSGNLIQGAVTTAAPTYTTAQTSPLSLDTAGNLRMNCTTGCLLTNGLATMANSQPVVVASDQKVSTQNASAAINIATATTTQLVALSGSTKIYVTHWDVIAGGTGNITLEYGTGTNCATGTTVLTGAYNLTAQAGIAAGSGIAPVLIVPSGNALCALTSAAVQMSGAVTYQQF